ncbi:hypothetical protein [Cellulosimicrobium sp. CUA-896]|uniref:hypothetical protein n=1 Tax=Cellulosimicrobium sp. CUA-896 TaxID=1517881 RepID=UPI00095FA25F|nr:hypothetical protein [Cellulosimicrobium sp. CUA-896]OLT55113.1 hypothetical protein BJF88_07640 [Cellulosimicrobium sp. CUA-896]
MARGLQPAGDEAPIVDRITVSPLSATASTPASPVEVTTQVRCLAGKAYLAVRATNTSDAAVPVELSTAYGSKASDAVAPGKSLYQRSPSDPRTSTPVRPRSPPAA